MSQLDEPIISGHAPIEKDEIEVNAPPKMSGALKLVVQNYAKSEKWLLSKQRVLAWKDCRILLEQAAPAQFWENTNVPRANVKTWTVAKHAQTIQAQITNAVFSDDTPFALEPRPGTTAETVRAIEALLGYQMEDCDSREEIDNGLLDCLTYGTMVVKWGWRTETRKRLVYEAKAAPITLDNELPGSPTRVVFTEEANQIVEREIEETVNSPYLEHVPLREVYPSPSLRSSDIRKSAYVVHRLKPSLADLECYRDEPGYTLPSKQELLDLIFPPEEVSPESALERNEINHLADNQGVPRDADENADPTEEKRFEMLEYWDNNRVIVVLNQKLVLRNERNPYGKIPFCSQVWWKLPGSFYGLGLAHTIGYEQLLQAGLINAELDQTTLNLLRGWIKKRGKTALTQDLRLRPGGIIEVDDMDDIREMPKIDAVPEVPSELQASDARAEAISGANELTMGGNMPDHGRSSITRTAEGVSTLSSGSQIRLEAFIERFADQVFIPVLDAFHEMNRALLPPAEMHKLLSKELALAYSGDTTDIRNARLSFDILAASRIQKRRQMGQSLPMLGNMLMTDPVRSLLGEQNKTLDINEYLNMWFDVVGWRNKKDLIRDMTDEEKQTRQQQSQAAQEAQKEQVKTQSETQGQLQVISADNQARGEREVMRLLLEHFLQTGGNPNALGL